MNSTDRKYRILSFAGSLKKNGLIKSLSSDPHYQLITPAKAPEALKAAASGPFDLILVDDDGSISIPELVIRAKGIDAETPILVFRETLPSLADDRLWTLGIDDCLVEPITSAKFLHHIARALKVRRLGVKCEELAKENQQLYQLAITDGLTRLINKRHLLERMNSEFARTKRFGGRLGAAICDIDHFKKVNDTYGHLVGDKILKAVAGLISTTVRSIDTAGRYGGEEFVLMLPETSLEGVANLAEKLRRVIEEHDFLADCDDLPGPSRLTISLGCASYPEDSAGKVEDLLETSDKRLYVAKQTGRNRACAGDIPNE